MTRVNERGPSKSARKREQLALQALGEKLIELPIPDLEAIGLDAALFEAVVDAKNMRAHGALRRQRQLIGKLMRTADAGLIESALVSLGSRERAAIEVFHTAEAWRDRIVGEGAPALAEFERLTAAPQPQIARLLREHEQANETGRRAVRRRLFREIHERVQKMEPTKCATEATPTHQ
ncbi:MAG TPA: ribosome biogenesis factor YjgA [Woeseiaceae bacterium]|nr:ribosome biogenesis factor YjgA [Woeseiaceae bacterium]